MGRAAWGSCGCPVAAGARRQHLLQAVPWACKAPHDCALGSLVLQASNSSCSSGLQAAPHVCWRSGSSTALQLGAR